MDNIDMLHCDILSVWSAHCATMCHDIGAYLYDNCLLYTSDAADE